MQMRTFDQSIQNKIFKITRTKLIYKLKSFLAKKPDRIKMIGQSQKLKRSIYGYKFYMESTICTRGISYIEILN